MDNRRFNLWLAGIVIGAALAGDNGWLSLAAFIVGVGGTIAYWKGGDA